MTSTSTAVSPTSTVNPNDIIYFYNPSLALPWVYAAFFGIALIPHLYYLCFRKSYYMIPFVIGILGELGGYITRFFSAKHPLAVGVGTVWATITTLLIILAPAFLVASHYMAYGRVITVVGERYSVIPAKWVTKIFVTLDVTSFIIQGTGGSLLSGSSPNLKVGKPILLLGFIVQIVSFALYAVFAYLYQRRALQAGEPRGPWVKVLRVLYAGVIAILIRSIYRVIEFGNEKGDGSGYFISHEGWFYALEATPIVVCVVLFAVMHPARYMQLDRRSIAANKPGNGAEKPLSDLSPNLNVGSSLESRVGRGTRAVNEQRRFV